MSGRPARDTGQGELAGRGRRTRKLKARNDKLADQLGRTRTALDKAGKAFALLENISGSADSGEN